MSQVKQLKELLESSYTTYKRHLTALSNSTQDGVTSSTRTIKSKIEAFESALDQLNSAHTSWVSKAELSEENLAAQIFSNQWLEQRWTEADTALDKANITLQTLEEGDMPPPLQHNQKVIILEQQMNSLKLSITNRIDSLVSLTEESITKEAHPTYTTMAVDISKVLQTDFRELYTQVVASSGNNLANVVKSLEEFRVSQEKRLIDVQLMLAKTTPSPHTLTNSSDSAPTDVRRGRSVEIEKCKLPSFSGDIISYPEFKKSWKKVAGVNLDEDNQIEQMKFKVDDHTKRIISRCNNMSEVWSSLDEEYAQEQEVVNAVNSTLRKLRSEAGSTPEYIVTLRNYIPGLETALTSVHGLEHLQTPDKVDFLVEKFDDLTQREWEYYRSKNTGKTWDRFFNFILDRYPSCRSMIARAQSRTPAQDLVLSMNSNAITAICVKCKKWVAKGGTYSCAACSYEAVEGAPIGHCLEHCPSYVSMSANQRSNCVRDAQWCPVHLSPTHNLDSCTSKNDPKSICGVNACPKHHHRSLHGSTTTFVVNINSVQSENQQHSTSPLNTPVLLSIQAVPTLSGLINVFFDDGSTCTLILHSAAQRLGLSGEEVEVEVTTVIAVTKTFSKIYTLTLFDINNEKHEIQAVGMERLNGQIKEIKVDGVKKLFSPEIQSVWDRVNSRPTGEVELLVGSDNLGLHPSEIEVHGNLKMYQSNFASGYVLRGSHPALEYLDLSNSSTSASVHHVSLHATRLSFKSIRDYFDANELDVQVPRRCNHCMNCEECTFLGQQLSLKEQYEYKIMEKNVEYDEVKKVFRVKYPFLEDPSILSDNKQQVVKIAMREEKKLIVEGLLDEFNEELYRMISHGALVELSKECRDSWTGPVHYVSLQHVLKPDSTTTPLRIVTNSSLSDRNGNSLNSIMMKGPNALSDQRDVISRWRSYESALCSDLTKAYYSIETGELEKHLRRVVWRFGKLTEDWSYFGFNTVSFGDKPAGVYLDIVINKSAKKFKAIDPPAAQKIMTDRYVDDLPTGGSPEEVKRMAGERSDPNDKFQTDGTLAQLLSDGNLNLKAIVTSGETDPEVINKLGKYVLGVRWNPTEDVVSIDMECSPLTELLNMDNINEVSLTPKKLLGIINKPHDLLGLVAPITIRAMIRYRDLFDLETPFDWDTEIPLKEKLKWVVIFQIFHEVSSITFQRSTKPKSAVGDPELIGYFDGSDDAYAAVVYIRWTLSNGSYDVNLACAKAKVTPLKRISTPRSELNGAVLLTRLLLFYLKSCTKAGVTPKTVWILGDSECTLASMEKTRGALGEYFGNRVGEALDNQSRIQQFCDVGFDGEWWHISSDDNAADQPTRTDSTAKDVAPDSPWQKGRSYLYQPVENWPVDRNFAERKESCIPDEEILKRFRGQVNQINTVTSDVGVENLIDPCFTNDWDRLIRRTQTLLLPFLRKRGIHDNSAMLEIAEKVWFKQAMSPTRQAVKEKKLTSLLVEEKDGLVVVVGRAKSGIHKILGKEYLPVIMRKTRVAYLIMLWAHKENHDARDITMSIACQKAWIVGAKLLATSITDSCVRCRFLHRLKVEQKMAELPPTIQLPCPPFSNIGIDLTGPHSVHAMTNKRATLKVWNVLFVCLNTKAIAMYLAPGYSTNDFFVAYDSFISERGIPTTVHSDRGSQLVAAGKEVVEYDWDCIAHRTSAQGTNWDFAPAGAQWRNGAVEIFVKKFKKSFELLYSKTRLNYAELSCAVKRIANVLNDRPLSVQKSMKQYPDADFLSPLTPNMLITGRSGSRAPLQRDIDYDELPQDRLTFVEELELAWWCQYKVQYFSSLVPTQKWVNAKRNICVDDIVLIEYKGKSAPGTYRLGRVKEVEIDPRDNLVRTCTVIYKLVKPSVKNVRDIFKDITSKEVRVPVQRLILILPAEEQ